MAELDKAVEEVAETTEAGFLDFSALLDEKFKPTVEAKPEVESAIKTLAAQALGNANLISTDAFETIESMVAAIDKKLSDQLSLILHNEEFQKLENSWRGLHYLVNNTESSAQMKIKVMNISKAELAKTLKRFKGTKWDQSPIFKKLYEQEYGTANGAPYGCLIGDYYFDQSVPDIEMLTEMSHVAAAAHAPFIGAAAPSILNMDTWEELSNPRDIGQIFDAPQYASWHSLRQSADAQYLSLAMPRFLGRMPYGEKTNPVEEFAFEEDVDGTDHSKYSWINAAYAMGANINRSFSTYGWSSQIAGLDSGGVVEGLPVHTFETAEGGIDAKCPTEISITDRRELELSNNGITSLVHYKNTDYAVFFKATSLKEPVKYDDPDATSNAKLATNLSYIFATSRFAHYLKHIVRNKIGASTTRGAMERDLQKWINIYVEPNPETASEEDLATRPLSAARVQVEDDEENPGFYKARFHLSPHYKLEGMTISLSLVSRLPGKEGG